MPGTESVTSVFSYFNPTRSPYYTSGLAACIALYFACDVERNDLWLWVAIPAFMVAALTLLLSIDSGNNLTREEHAEQLRFARSTSISSAVLVLSFAGTVIARSVGDPKVPHAMFNFKVNVVICCIQIALFVLYNWALNRQDISGADRNYVQITLLTSAFLVDTCCNLAQLTDSGSAHHQLTAYGLGFLWICCVIFWVVKLIGMRIIQIQRPEPVAQARAASVGGPPTAHPG